MPTYNFDPLPYQDRLMQLLTALVSLPQNQRTASRLNRLVKRYPKPAGGIFARHELVVAYQHFAGQSSLPDLTDQPAADRFLEFLQMKPVRTISGVTPVTVLTKPFPCPGTCIFCPSDVRMPKSYLADEPGAQRAERNYFDPYLQMYSRLSAYQQMGHPTDKVEIIILGGTWSYYPEPYQIWFVKECFRALNDFGAQDDRLLIEKRYQTMNAHLRQQQHYAASNDPQQNQQATQQYQIKRGAKKHNALGKKSQPAKTYNQVISEMYVAPERLGGFDRYQSATWPELEYEQQRNEMANCRNVGLVIETRPDNISEQEVTRIRRLGCTKAQIGFQSLNDQVLAKNHRGHDVAATRRAVRLLRQAGFKIHGHWMANLYGSSVAADKEDYIKLFSDQDFCPDELKIYPCSLIESAELMTYYQQGKWRPYSHEELLEVLTHCFLQTPSYCRLTRVIRDIPATDIVVGNTLSNFRQIAEQQLAAAGQASVDIRNREIRKQSFNHQQISLQELQYTTSVSQEYFLQFVAPVENGDRKLLGFLRLSLPLPGLSAADGGWLTELQGAALIREVHVYGPAQSIGKKKTQAAQHLGLGTQLLERARVLAQQAGFQKISVISAIGTKAYYRKRGFQDGQLYQHFMLDTDGQSSSIDDAMTGAYTDQ